MQCADLRDLILTAYGIYGNGANPVPGSFRMQVVGGPPWIDHTRYDISAKAAGNPPRSEMFGAMLQSLLEERFQLRVHRESREGRVYFLTLAKGGPKLRATPEGVCVVSDINRARQAAQPACGKAKMTRGDGVVTLDMVGASMDDLCAQLNLAMDREVIDRTALAGRFDVHLEVAPGDLQPKFLAGRAVDQPPAASDSDQEGPSISVALQKQAGLRLESGKVPVPVLVVDRMEQPSRN